MKSVGLFVVHSSAYRRIAAFMCVMLLASFTPNSASSADTTSIKFRWSSKYGGSIVIDYCADGKHTWLTSEELDPNPRELGSWNVKSGCQSYIAATGVQDGDILEIGLGTGDSTPNGSLFDAVGTQYYEVMKGSNGLNPPRFVRRITPENAWCGKGNCQFKDPNGTLCAATQTREPTNKEIFDDNHKKIAVVFLKHSLACGTRWVTVSSSVGKLAYISASITTDWQGNTPTHTWNDLNEPTTDVWTTMRLDTEGMTQACGSVRLDLTRGKEFSVCFNE